jgi:hypothetical protein
MNHRLIVLGTFALLLGCNSFNRTERYMLPAEREQWARETMGQPSSGSRSVQGKVQTKDDDEEDEPKPEVKRPVKKPPPRVVRKPAPTPAPVAKAVKPTTSMCPMYTPPPEGKMPGIPFEALEAVKGNPSKINDLERQHILDLRQYIADRQRLNEEARKKYLEECQRILERGGK